MEKEQIEKLIKIGRDFMKMPIEDPTYKSDQDLKKPQPPLVKEPMTNNLIDLPINYNDLNIDNDFLHIINTRKSHRVYTLEKMTLLELSYLLWTTQGVKEIRGKSYATIRTVPCGGARHEFECYMAIQNVEGLKDGLYHYLPMIHKIEFIKSVDDLQDFIGKSLGGQSWANKANVVFYYSMVAYRAEWRYGIYAHRVALIDAGHITENMYLASTSIGLGGCALGYIDEAILDKAFGLDGTNEFIFYSHPVGKIDQADSEKENDIYAFVKEQGL